MGERMRAGKTLIVTVVVGLLVAGCGGHKQPPPENQSFKAKYVAVERAYKAVGVELSETLRQGSTMPAGQAIAAFNDEASRFAALRRKLGALAPPAAGRRYFTQYLQSLDRIVTDLRAFEKATVGNGNERTGRAIGRRLRSDIQTAGQARFALETALGF